jgi:hypothetical protein
MVTPAQGRMVACWGTEALVGCRMETRTMDEAEAERIHREMQFDCRDENMPDNDSYPFRCPRCNESGVLLDPGKKPGWWVCPECRLEWVTVLVRPAKFKILSADEYRRQLDTGGKMLDDTAGERRFPGNMGPEHPA